MTRFSSLTFRLSLCLACTVSIASVLAQQGPSIHIKKASHKISVDARDDESAWKDAEVAGNFRQYFPFDSSASKVKTEVRLTYDAHHLYIFAKMYNLGSRKYVTPSLRRDFRGEANDALVVILDTYQDKTNAFSLS